MAKGKSIVRGECRERKIDVQITLDNLDKPAENSGVLAQITNEVHDIMRKHFCAHNLKVVIYKEPKLPYRLRVRGTRKVILKGRGK